jgi:anaerobic magnesium-protoporphyrin IX monomethyl ester cyclase
VSTVALVRPPMILPRAMLNSSPGVPSIGVAYLAGAAKAAGHDVVVVDALGEAVHRFSRLAGTGLLLNGLTARDIIARIPKRPDVIGVSCMYSNEWVYYRVVIQALLEHFPGVPIVAGGEHVTADPEYSLRCCPGLHSCVLGEGEETFVDLIQALSDGRPQEQVPGIAFLDDRGDLVRTPSRARIRSIDDIALPSWDESPLENYLANGMGMASVRGRNMPMIASRGCPYQCTFCSNPNMWTQKWSARDPSLVVKEMKLWRERFNTTHFEFYDLTTIIRKDWIMAFTGLLLEEAMNVTWALPSGTRSEALDAEVLDRLYRTGCRELTYAPESGSPATLKRIKKQVNVPKMLASMRAAARQGISVKANMIIGFPGQTLREVTESYAFIVRMAWAGARDVAVFPFVPYPGSELFLELLDEGKIDKGGAAYEAFLSGNVYNEVAGMKSWSEHISDRWLKVLTVGGIAWFYLFQFLFRPWRGVAAVLRLVAQRPQTMLERILDGVLRNFVHGARRNIEDVEVVPPAPAIPAARPIPARGPGRTFRLLELPTTQRAAPQPNVARSGIHRTG